MEGKPGKTQIILEAKFAKMSFIFRKDGKRKRALHMTLPLNRNLQETIY